MPTSESFDTVIIGAGPAGASCALELHESRVNYLLVERASSAGGQLSEIHNPLSNLAPAYWPNGPALKASMTEMLAKIGCNLRLNTDIEKVDLKSGWLVTSSGELKAKTILLATGYRLRRLDLAGLRDFAESVCYHVSSGSDRYSGATVAVVGGGDNAVMQAIELADRCSKVYLINRTDKFKSRPDLLLELRNRSNTEILVDSKVSELGGNSTLEWLRLASASGKQRRIDACGLVVKIGFIPNTELFAGQTTMDSSGHILIDQNCQTSVGSTFAAGDITNPGYPRIATALGQGTLAAKAIRRILERH
jgi:thioredoxin reductase (NADPH)